MKGYLIDSAARKIRAVTFDRADISTLAGFGESGFFVGWQWVCGDLLLVGHEPTSEDWFRVNRRQDGRPYAGNGLVIPSDLSPEPALQIADVLAEISWVSDRKARARIAEQVLVTEDTD